MECEVEGSDLMRDSYTVFYTVNDNTKYFCIDSLGSCSDSNFHSKIYSGDIGKCKYSPYSLIVKNGYIYTLGCEEFNTITQRDLKGNVIKKVAMSDEISKIVDIRNDTIYFVREYPYNDDIDSLNLFYMIGYVNLNNPQIYRKLILTDFPLLFSNIVHSYTVFNAVLDKFYILNPIKETIFIYDKNLILHDSIVLEPYSRACYTKEFLTELANMESKPRIQKLTEFRLSNSIYQQINSYPENALVLSLNNPLNKLEKIVLFYDISGKSLKNKQIAGISLDKNAKYGGASIPMQFYNSETSSKFYNKFVFHVFATPRYPNQEIVRGKMKRITNRNFNKSLGYSLVITYEK
jgi:hypothetical protein